MPKYNTGQDFDEAFISGLQFQQKLNQQRDEFQQDIMFKIRQQSLLGDYYADQKLKNERDYELDQAKLEETKRINDFNMGKQPKPEEGVLRTEKGGGLINDIYGYSQQDMTPATTTNTDGMEDILLGDVYNKEFITKIERRNDPTYQKPEKPTENGGGDKKKGADISGEVGEMNKIITLMDSLAKEDDTIEYEKGGETVSVSKVFLRGEGKKYMSDAMTKAGVPLEGDLVTEIRSKAGIKSGDSSKIKRQKLKDAIDFVRLQGAISDTEYEALKYWSEIGTR